MGKTFGIAAMAAFLAFAVATPASATPDPSGNYKRKNGDLVHMWVDKGKLYCKIIQGKKMNFEMCHGMDPAGEEWKGSHMKHPSMPGFMTFNGTVSMEPNSAIKIKGCAMGNAMCDSEIWQRVN
ncbi:MAG: DUF2147 domain-containing protein [Sphingomonadales bacterium]|nr:DUF2147 domain-containing protein [Sphingomonadales bacterium]MDE2569165.1 DUF2147 domain-containing protein [Sphingomonadales bacterium]